MEIPAPIITGTIIYGLIAVALMVGVFGALVTGGLSKDNASIANIVIAIAVFFSWIFWMCAWLHQWHPLIKPIYEE